jgi:hypothetical protein
MKRDVIKKLGEIDPRAIYWALVLMLALPYLFIIGLPMPISPMTKEFYDYIERLEPGSTVLYSCDVGPAVLPELGGSIVAIARHLAKRPLKVIIIAVWVPEAAPINEAYIVPAFKEAGKQYGIDYVNLGFLPGGEGAVARLAYDIKGLKPTDYYGNEVAKLPMMKDINTAEDIDLIIAGDFPDWLYMRQDWVPKFNRPLISLKSAGGAVEVRGMYPHSTKAILGGSRAGAEYEVLIGRPGMAKAMLESLTLGVILFTITVILGNIHYIPKVWRRK